MECVFTLLQALSHNLEQRGLSKKQIQITIGILVKNGIETWTDLMNLQSSNDVIKIKGIPISAKYCIVDMRLKQNHILKVYATLSLLAIYYKIPVRLYNVLKRRFGNPIMENFWSLSDEDLLKIKGIGPKLLMYFQKIRDDSDRVERYTEKIKEKLEEFRISEERLINEQTDN